MTSYSDDELISWLEVCLKNENLKKIKIKNVSGLGKGEGMVGDLLFVQLTSEAEGRSKEYNLALKCSKDSKLLRQVSPTKSFFYNEIHFYEKIYPAFVKFQEERGVQEPFRSVPKYYGSYLDDSREVMAFENLTSVGFQMWDKKKPMTRRHLNLIIGEYAKLHALSLAMKDQDEETFEILTEPLKKFFKMLKDRGSDVVSSFCRAVYDVHDLLQDVLEEEILKKWKNFGQYMEKIFINTIIDFRGTRVIAHGDCWNNNFMFRIFDEDVNQPVEVSILDWQISKLSPLVTDLAHFIFTCISEEDLANLEDILDEYYSRLSDFLVQLKSNPEIYSKEKFLRDWKENSKFGILMTSIAMKICTREKEEAVDVTEAAEQGDFSKAFLFDVKNEESLKERMRPVVKYVVENGLV